MSWWNKEYPDLWIFLFGLILAVAVYALSTP